MIPFWRKGRPLKVLECITLYSILGNHDSVSFPSK
jgi:hypothetical protein